MKNIYKKLAQIVSIALLIFTLPLSSISAFAKEEKRRERWNKYRK